MTKKKGQVLLHSPKMGERRNFSHDTGFARELINVPASQRAAVVTAHLSCWEDNSSSTAGKDLVVMTWRVQVELCVLGEASAIL